MNRFEYFSRATIVKPLDGVAVMRQNLDKYAKYKSLAVEKRAKEVERIYIELLEYPEILACSANMRNVVLYKSNEYIQILNHLGVTPPQIFEDMKVIMKIIETRPDYKDSPTSPSTTTTTTTTKTTTTTTNTYNLRPKIKAATYNYNLRSTQQN